MAKTIDRDYARDGYYFPLDVLDDQECGRFRDHLMQIINSRHASTLGNRGQINNLHVFSPYVNEIIRSPAILGAIENIIGSDILVWSTSIFLKAAHSESFVSWHQDLTYWGLNSDQVVSVWLALNTVNQTNGCMHFLPRSHRFGQLPHEDIIDSENLLTRGQRASIEINESQSIGVELQPGQASLHHGYLLHRSGPNHSDQPRLGLVATYLATSVQQTKSPVDYAMLVQGTDEFGHFSNIPKPSILFGDESLNFHRQMLLNTNDVLYDGASNRQTAIK